jgi:hypothetical protein
MDLCGDAVRINGNGFIVEYALPREHGVIGAARSSEPLLAGLTFSYYEVL